MKTEEWIKVQQVKLINKTLSIKEGKGEKKNE